MRTSLKHTNEPDDGKAHVVVSFTDTTFKLKEEDNNSRHMSDPTVSLPVKLSFP